MTTMMQCHGALEVLAEERSRCKKAHKNQQHVDILEKVVRDVLAQALEDYYQDAVRRGLLTP